MYFRRSAPAPPDPPGPVGERDYFAAAIGWLACQIIARRFQIENERNERHRLMAIEIKGLKLQAMTARGHLDRLSQAYAKFNEAAPAHAADVEGMAEQVTEMQSDLEFATQHLGNSPAVSGNGSEPQKLPKAEFRADDETKPASLSGNDILNEIPFKEVASEAPATFREPGHYLDEL